MDKSNHGFQFVNLVDASIIKLHLILATSGCSEPIGSLHTTHIDWLGTVHNFGTFFFFSYYKRQFLLLILISRLRFCFLGSSSKYPPVASRSGRWCPHPLSPLLFLSEIFPGGLSSSSTTFASLFSGGSFGFLL